MFSTGLEILIWWLILYVFTILDINISDALSQRRFYGLRIAFISSKCHCTHIYLFAVPNENLNYELVLKL